MLEKHFGRKIPVAFDDWRPGDQKIFVADIRKAEKEFGWKPNVSVEAGVGKLYAWITANKTLFSRS